MFTLMFSVEDLNIINQALMQMPYGSVAGLVQKINDQLKKQQENNTPGDKDGNN